MEGQDNALNAGRLGVLVSSQTGMGALINGLQKANEGFLQALIRYSRFQHIDCFVDDTLITVFQQRWQSYIKHYASARQIDFVGASRLPSYLSAFKYTAFHKGDPYISSLAELRKQCDCRHFAITGRAHTLSTDVTLSKTRDLLLSPLQPCDAIICSSNAQQQVLERQLALASAGLKQYTGKALNYSGQLACLPLGVDDVSESVGDKYECRKALGYPKDSCILLCVGRFSYRDKMDLYPLFIAANDLLEDRGITNFLIVLVGQGDASGGYIQGLLQLGYDLNLEGRIRFELSADDERKHLIFQAADIFVSIADNVQESFGIAPVEAMNYSLPVVLSDWNGYRELVVEGESGYLTETLSTNLDFLSVPMNSVQAGLGHMIEAQGTAVNVKHLTDYLQVLICQPEKRKAMGMLGRARVMARYHWPLLIEQYHGIVERLQQGRDEAVGEHIVEPQGAYYHTIFQHYPTRHLSPDDYLKSTDRALRILLGDETEVHFQEIDHLIDKFLLSQVIMYCLSGVKVQSVYAAFPQAQSLPFILVWLCKYQWLDCMTEKPSLTIPTIAPVNLHGSKWVKGVKGVVEDSLKGVDCLRRDYLRPIMGWLATQIKRRVGQYTPDDQLLKQILQLQLVMLDEKLLQAIGWFGEERGLTIYNEVMVALRKQGGFCALQHRYPHWFRLGKRLCLRALRSISQIIERTFHDLPAINQRFKPIWHHPASRVVHIDAPLRVEYLSVVILTFDNSEKLVYKNRDIRMNSYLVDHQSPRGESLAEKLNKWLEAFPGIGTYSLLPREVLLRKKKVHYGFVQYISGSDEGIVLNHEEGKHYYQRLGVLIGFGLMLGMTDLHTMNVISSNVTPYPIDLENIFQNDALQALEQEVENPAKAFMRGVSGTSLDKLCVFDFFQNFYSCRARLGSVKVKAHKIGFDDQIEIRPALKNKVTIGHRDNTDRNEQALVAGYGQYISEGIRAVVRVLCQHQMEWLTALDRCSSLQVRFQPIMRYADLTKQVSHFHTFSGFQRLSYRQLQHYFYRSASRLCTTGVEVQRWTPAHWQESVTDLVDAMARQWLKGCQGRFVKYPGQCHACLRQSDGSVVQTGKPGAAYFADTALEQLKKSVVQLASDDEKREQFLTLLTSALEAWLNDSLQPRVNVEQPERAEAVFAAELAL